MVHVNFGICFVLFLTARPWAGAVLNLPDVFFSLGVERHILPLGHIVSWTSNHATYDVSSPEVVETVIHGQCYGHCFLYCM